MHSIISTTPSTTQRAPDLLHTEADDALDPSELGHELRSFEVPVALHGQRLDRVLVDLVAEFSRSYLQQLAGDGAVTVNGKLGGLFGLILGIYLFLSKGIAKPR